MNLSDKPTTREISQPEGERYSLYVMTHYSLQLQGYNFKITPFIHPMNDPDDLVSFLCALNCANHRHDAFCERATFPQSLKDWRSIFIK